MVIGNVDFKTDRTYIMGIINLTPDSFYDGGRLFVNDKLDIDKVLRRVGDMIEEGADIIDIGGESTRPGARPISADEELSRLMPALTKIRAEVDAPISVDTYKPTVARTVIDEGADMIIANGEDVSVIEDIIDGKKIGTQFHANVNHTFNLEEYIMESMV